MNKTYYEILNVSKYATPSEIKDAYTEYSVFHHPLRDNIKDNKMYR